MLQDLVLAKLEDTTQAALLSGLTGNSYTVAQVSPAGNGLGGLLLLSPDGGTSAAGQGVVALKLEGARQVAQLSGLIGKTVTVGQAPAMIGGVGKWVAFCPNAGLAAKGAATAAAAAAINGADAASQLLMLKLDGAQFAAQTPALAGKSFTVIKQAAVTGEAGKWLFLQPVGGAAKDIVTLKVQNGAGQLSWLVGKTYTVGSAPLIAADNAGKYLILQPASGLAGKATVAATVKGTTAAQGVNGMTAAQGVCPAMKTVALNGTTTGTASAANAVATAGKTAVASTVAKGAAGTIWSGTGFSLGLGLGLGPAGPLILGALVAAAGYGLYKSQIADKLKAAAVDDDLLDSLN